ncbi:MAG: SapC family protein [Sphingobium sp.]|uniref:SapC family protein n=1 Tax=Sphingobium sp. CECT 9361 TaxID=2845384 RepID=UPI001E4B873F|nr:SapC family protein [Sphingobium sp. CECT 9361]
MTDTPTPPLPPFYRAPQPLNAAVHADWRLRDGDITFAADTPHLPIVIGELAAAARSFPIVFAAGDAQPVVILGLERRNLFVADGHWSEDAYVPAYVRRYPFGFITTVNRDGFALAIDAGSDRVVQDGEDGAAWFDDGQPSSLTREALAFCGAFQSEATATRDFADALVAQDLLVDRRADATLPDGRTLGLDGFRIVDGAKLAALPEPVVLEWHNQGWLALVHFHLASLDRFQDLLVRQARLAPVTPASSNTASDRPSQEVQVTPATAEPLPA